MADAPSSGGGSSWGAFEVILALLLAIGLFSNITGKPITPVTSSPSTPSPNTTLTTPSGSSNRCGLSITAPLSLEKVSTAVHLSGVVTGCNWKPQGTTALFAQLVNGGGVPVSDFISVQTNGTDILNSAFDTLIPVTGTPTGTGYLILVPATTQSEKAVTVRIPLHFVRK